jgi:Protein tyrosine phosphatase-like protein, PTPLA
MRGMILWSSIQEECVWLTVLRDRYNLFFVLYPLGISSEAWLVYKSIPSAKKQNPLLEYVLYAILGIYVPGKQEIGKLD